MKKIITIIVAAPVLTLFVGVGVWAFRMSDTWTPANTDALIGGLVAACLGGGLVIALILAALWALVFYNRLSSGPDLIPSGWDQRSTPPLPDHQSGWREVQPPQIITNQNAGEWHSQGPAVYDLWKEEPPGQIVDGQWQ